MERAIAGIIREGRADLARFLERLFWIKTGTGGGFKYLTEVPSARMVAQEQPMSCAAACIKQFLKDIEVSVEESEIRVMAKTDEEGTFLYRAREALQQKLPNETVLGGQLGLASYAESLERLKMLHSSKKPWIVQIRPDRFSRFHTVLVDDIVDGVVHIRDPWNLETGFGIGRDGTTATMRLEDFVTYWELTGNGLLLLK